MNFSPSTFYPIIEEAYYMTMRNNYIREAQIKKSYELFDACVSPPTDDHSRNYTIYIDEGLEIEYNPYSLTVRTRLEWDTFELLRINDWEFPPPTLDEEWHKILFERLEQIYLPNKNARDFRRGLNCGIFSNF